MVAVSVIIPVYNTEPYLQSCIDGCMMQTMEDIEFIFVNDASGDGSLSILRDNERRYAPRMKVIDSPVNLHVGGARNLGIAAAEGEYIGFVDSDDIPLPEMYEMLYKKAKAENADLCFIQNSRINESCSFDDIKGKAPESFAPSNVWPERTLQMANRDMTDKDREWLLVKSPGHVWNALWKRSLLEKANVLYPEHSAYEDNYWAAVVEAYVEKIAFVQSIGYLYRVNPDSITQARNNKNSFDRITIRDMLLQTVRERGLLKRLSGAYEYLYTFRDSFTTFRILATKFDTPNYTVMKQVIKDLKTSFPKWKQNDYFRTQVPLRIQIEDRFICLMPVICGWVLHLLSMKRK